MADEDDAARGDAPANKPSRRTLREHARANGLADWQLAQLCAVTKHRPDDAIEVDAIVRAEEFLNKMTLGG